MSWHESGVKRQKFRGELFTLQEGKCCYCEREMRLASLPHKCRTPKDYATFEHLMQKCEGGTNAQKNIKLACHQCNRKRPNNVDWMTYKSFRMGEITESEMKAIAVEARYLARDKNPLFTFSKSMEKNMSYIFERAFHIRERVLGDI